MMRFDLNLLGALYALLTEQNVTRAAEMMDVTQPTMSGMLQRLRYQFDDPLLVRNGRGMVLTHFAASLVEPVREAIKGVGSLVRAEGAFDPVTSTRAITLIASQYSASILIPRVVARMARQAPGMRLLVQAPNTSIERMMVGDVDLCIATDERGLPLETDGETKLHSEPLFSDEFVCIVSRTHPLRDGANREAYFRFPHVGVDMPGISSTILAAHRTLVPDYRPAYAVGDFSLIPFTVASTHAVGIVPERLARIAARTFAIRSFAPPLNLPEMIETMCWYTRHHEEPALAWLRGVISEEARACMDIGGQNLLKLAGADRCDADPEPSTALQSSYGLS